MDVESYEEARKKNLVENQEFLRGLMKDFKPVSEKKKPPKRLSSGTRRTSKDPGFPASRRHSEPVVLRRSTRRTSRPSTYSTIAMEKDFDDENVNTSDATSKHHEELFVKIKSPVRKRRSAPLTRIENHEEARSPEQISKEEMKMVADVSSEKVWDQDYGTSCHQCRQKTFDMKTICRSGACLGIRGQFCGPCLRNRYGEDAREALKDPDWECPPCRGICNCSICRRRSGKTCTGILVHLAKDQGYSDVASYLDSLTKSK